MLRVPGPCGGTDRPVLLGAVANLGACCDCLGFAWNGLRLIRLSGISGEMDPPDAHTAWPSTAVGRSGGGGGGARRRRRDHRARDHARHRHLGRRPPGSRRPWRLPRRGLERRLVRRPLVAGQRHDARSDSGPGAEPRPLGRPALPPLLAPRRRPDPGGLSPLPAMPGRVPPRQRHPARTSRRRGGDDGTRPRAPRGRPDPGDARTRPPARPRG